MRNWPVLLLFTLCTRAVAGEPGGAGAEDSPPPSASSNPDSSAPAPEAPAPGIAPEAPPSEVLAAPPAAESAPPSAPSAEERLDQAVRAYQQGRPEEARVVLASLVNDPDLSDRELRQQARVYLGEVLYVQGQEDAAFKVFEIVLQEEPDYRIDPFRHPPDVCGFFEVVRASTTALTPRPNLAQPLPSRPPASAWVGFGVYQRSHGERRLANTLLIGQTALGLASAGGYAWITSQRHYNGQAELARLQALRATQWGLTVGFWGLYTWGTLDARADWKNATATGASVTGVW